MKPAVWVKKFIGLMVVLLVLTAAVTAVVDPFFHFHAPLPGLYYELEDQRSQNDGITKHFDYDAVITGTSMVENFRASEFDALFGVNSIKIPYPGATYREIAENLDTAFATHPDIRIVVRALDYTHLVEDASAMRTDMGEYPDYLYDRNPFNDVKYLFNRDALFTYTLPAIARRIQGHAGGHTSFDDYGWTGEDAYGVAQVLQDFDHYDGLAAQEELTAEERALVTENITQNVIRAAKENPNAEFYIFFPPYSVAWWGELAEEGTLFKQIAAEELAENLMLEVPNIRIFSFNLREDIVCDLSHYKDAGHYAPSVNTQILQMMKTGEGEITRENVSSYAEAQRAFFMNYDYAALLEEAADG